MPTHIKFPDMEWLGYDPECGNIHGYTAEQADLIVNLVVQECIKQCAPIGSDYVRVEWHKGFDAGTAEVAKRIKARFGIQ